MACGNTYTPEQIRLALRTQIPLRHPKPAVQLSEHRKEAILDQVKAEGFDSEGQKGLPRLHIFTKDVLTVDQNRDILVWRSDLGSWVPKVGVAFAHSLSSGNYKGFSIQKVQSVKHKILNGELTTFHFVTSESFPAGIDRVIEEANDELREKWHDDEHLINYHHHKDYPFLLPSPVG
jgi:hypothetical protein